MLANCKWFYFQSLPLHQLIPISVDLWLDLELLDPFALVPLQDLHSYYESEPAKEVVTFAQSKLPLFASLLAHLQPTYS